MEMLYLMTVLGYTAGIFCVGYMIGKDMAKHKK